MSDQREYQLDCLAAWVLDHFETVAQRRACFLRMWLNRADPAKNITGELRKLVRSIHDGEYSEGIEELIQSKKTQFDEAEAADAFIEDLKARVMRIFNERVAA